MHAPPLIVPHLVAPARTLLLAALLARRPRAAATVAAPPGPAGTCFKCAPRVPIMEGAEPPTPLPPPSPNTPLNLMRDLILSLCPLWMRQCGCLELGLVEFTPCGAAAITFAAK